jgi:hypothetical protein
MLVGKKKKIHVSAFKLYQPKFLLPNFKICFAIFEQAQLKSDSCPVY